MRAGNRFCPLKNPRPGVNTRASGGLRAARDGRRSVAQPGRALASGARGRRFESSHSDHRSPVRQTRKAWVLRPELSDLAKKVPPSLPWPLGNPTALNRCVNAPARPGRVTDQCDRRKLLQKQCLRLGKGIVEHRIDRLSDPAVRGFMPVANGKDGWLSERFVQLARHECGQIRCDPPAAGMSAPGSYKSCLTQQPHDAPHDHRVDLHISGKFFRRHRARLIGHMQKRMLDAGKAAVSFPAPSFIA